MVFYLIQTGKMDLINSIYQIMVVSMLMKNWNCIYSSHYIIKFIDFMPIYYTIKLDIVSSCMVFSYLYLGSIDLLQVLINNIIFPFKKTHIFL